MIFALLQFHWRKLNFFAFKDAYKEQLESDLENDYPELEDKVKTYLRLNKPEKKPVSRSSEIANARLLDDRKRVYEHFTEHVRKERDFLHSDFVNYFSYLRDAVKRSTPELQRKDVFSKFILLKDEFRDVYQRNIHKGMN